MVQREKRAMIKIFPLLVLLLLESTPSVRGQVSLTLGRVGYNYIVQMIINNQTTDMLLDSGNDMLTILNNSAAFAIPKQAVTPTSCLYLLEDTTNVEYATSNPYVRCGLVQVSTSFTRGTAIQATINATIASIINIDNNILHAWNTTDGDVGLSYPYCLGNAGCEPTPFETLLSTLYENNLFNQSQVFPYFNTSSNTSHRIIGIDLAPQPQTSTLQLGGILSQYIESITWLSQPTDTPIYHEFMMNDLSFCGNNLFSNYSSTWPVLVDTGCVCLMLPGEIYDTWTAWFDNSIPITNINDLPSFSFSVSSPMGTFSIPLGSLLIENEAIMEEPGAPTVTVQGVTKRLCVLRGDTASSSPAPRIVFGTMVLHSLYFAADYQAKSVGLASKLSAANVLQGINTNFTCKAQTICQGQQSYSPQSNSCLNPTCSNYFFMEQDATGHRCQYASVAYGFGVFFLLVVTFLEVVSFFTLEVSALDSLNSSAPTESTAYVKSRFSPVTIFVGKYTAQLVDYIIIRLLGLVSDDQHQHQHPTDNGLEINNNNLQGNGGRGRDHDADAAVPINQPGNALN